MSFPLIRSKWHTQIGSFVSILRQTSNDSFSEASKGPDATIRKLLKNSSLQRRSRLGRQQMVTIRNGRYNGIVTVVASGVSGFRESDGTVERPPDGTPTVLSSKWRPRLVPIPRSKLLSLTSGSRGGRGESRMEEADVQRSKTRSAVGKAHDLGAIL